jgi:hypothetical protein
MIAFMTTMGSTNWFTCGAMAKITPLRQEEIGVSDEEGALLSFPYLPFQLHTRAPRVISKGCTRILGRLPLLSLSRS